MTNSDMIGLFGSPSTPCQTFESPELQLPLKMKGFRFYYGRNIDLDGKLFFSAFVLKYFQFVPTVCFKIFSLSHSFWHLQIDFSYNGVASFLYFEKLKYTFYIVMEERKTNWL